MVIIPNTYEEALEQLNHSELDILAGGTDVMVKKRNWAGLAPKFEKDTLCAFHLKELQYINSQEDGIHIGSMTRLEDLLLSDIVPLPLKTAVLEMASPGIRHVGTIGGNIGNASPAGDSLPILYVYDTLVILESEEGIRSLPINEFIVGPGQTTKKFNEIIKEIVMKDINYKGFYYEKVGGRRSDAISKLSFIGLYNRDAAGRVCDFRVSFGAVYKTMVRNREFEELFIRALNQEELRHDGKTLSNMVSIISDNSIVSIINKYEELIQPIDDQRSNAKYRKACAISLLKSFLNMIGGD